MVEVVVWVEGVRVWEVGFGVVETPGVDDDGASFWDEHAVDVVI